MIRLKPDDLANGEQFLSRKQETASWGVSTETVKRRSRAGILPSLCLNSRSIRYRLSDIKRIEQEATIIHDNPRPISPVVVGGLE